MTNLDGGNVKILIEADGRGVSGRDTVQNHLYVFQICLKQLRLQKHKDDVYLTVAQKLQKPEKCLQTSCSELMTLAFSGENRSSMA